MANGKDNGLSNGNGGPIWVQVASRFGIPALIALGLIYFLAGHVDGEIHEIRDGVQEQRIEQRFWLRAICLNTAETENERANCAEHR